MESKRRELDPLPREWHSFDGEVLREPYDNDVECESYFNSQRSFDSDIVQKKKI